MTEMDFSKADGIAYVSVNGTDHKFHFIADGGRPVLEIYVDAKPGDLFLPIRINAVGAPPDAAQATKGMTVMAHIVTSEDGDTPDGILSVPDMEPIASYIVPRIATMMARVYVPTSDTDG